MLTVNINTINRTNYVLWQTFSKIDSLNSTVDSCSFSTRKYGTKSWKPEIGDAVEVLNGATVIFAGNIVSVSEENEGAMLMRYKVDCKDWTYLMDKVLVFDTYSGTPIEAIVRDLVTLYCPTFTATPIASTGIDLEYILFNYEQPSKCIQRLAEMIGYDWYVDYSKNVHFFSKAIGETSPFNLTDTNGKYVFRSLKVSSDYSQVKNTIYVRGGEYVGTSRADKIGVGDNVTKSFKTPYRYDAEPIITVSGTPQTVGIDYIDSEDSHDCLWNYQEKVIKFKTPPVSGDVVATASPRIPVLIKASRSSSVSVYGKCEYVIIDKTIISKDAARQRAEAELIDYALPIKEATFLTTEDGLRSGQKINIQSTIRGTDQDFIINRVKTTCQSPTEGFYYQVEASTSRPLGIIRFLQKQLEATNKKVGIFQQEGEVLDVIMDLEGIDSVKVSETLTLNSVLTIMNLKGIDSAKIDETLIRMIKDSPPVWVAGEYFPTDDADRKRPAFCDRGCHLVA